MTHLWHVNVYFIDQHITQRGTSMELNFEGFEMQKWNIPADRAQRVDEKNGIMCLVIMFTPSSIVIKMSKMAHFLYFLLIALKNQSQSGILRIIGFWATMSKISSHENTMFMCFFDIFTFGISEMGTPKPINHSIFWNSSIRSFSCT